MKLNLKNLILTLTLLFTGVAVSLAQAPQMGTWKLNEAKSKIPAGVMKNTTVVYEVAGDSIKVSTDGTDATGKPMHTEWTGKFDGKSYPLSGDPSSDSRSYTKVNDHILNITNKMGGKATTTGRIVVAPDGKSRTITTTGTDSAGNKTVVIGRYDKA